MALDDEMKEAIEFREKEAREWGNLASLSVMGHSREFMFLAREQAEMYRNEAKRIRKGG